MFLKMKQQARKEELKDPSIIQQREVLEPEIRNGDGAQTIDFMEGTIEPQSSRAYAQIRGQLPPAPPLVVRFDDDGVLWCAFVWARDLDGEHVKMEYTIRCDVESVDLNALDNKWKDDHRILASSSWPFSEKIEAYHIGWALAHLNPCLRVDGGVLGAAVNA